LFGTVAEISALGLIDSHQYESSQETDYPDINFMLSLFTYNDGMLP
jgi:hypothetical protein